MEMLDDPKRMNFEETIENKVEMSHQWIANTFEVAEVIATIEVKSPPVAAIEENQQVKKLSAPDEDSIGMERGGAKRPGTDVNIPSPSDKSSCGRSKRAGNDEEENVWSGDEEKRGGNVNVASRDGIHFGCALNFGSGFHDEEEPRKQSNSGSDGDLWERIMCSAIIVVAYFIELMRMRRRMKIENEDEVIYYCRIGTNNLYFMCFKFASPFRLRTLRKQQHGRHNNKTQQPPPLPPKAINNNHTPIQHTAVSNQQKIAAIAWNETR